MAAARRRRRPVRPCLPTPPKSYVRLLEAFSSSWATRAEDLRRCLLKARETVSSPDRSKRTGQRKHDRSRRLRVDAAFSVVDSGVPVVCTHGLTAVVALQSGCSLWCRDGPCSPKASKAVLDDTSSRRKVLDLRFHCLEGQHYRTQLTPLASTHLFSSSAARELDESAGRPAPHNSPSFCSCPRNQSTSSSESAPAPTTATTAAADSASFRSFASERTAVSSSSGRVRGARFRVGANGSSARL